MGLTLVIGDPHAKPGVSNRRFDWLGNLIAEELPEVIVCMGDFNDMESLSSYDVGKKSFEGRRYKCDIAAGIDALKRINAPIDRLNANRKRAGKKPYRPRKIMLGGNHDDGRLARVIESDPKMDGTIGIADCQYTEYGWEYVKFLTPITVAGITYSHYFTSGVMGRPIGGEMPALSLINKMHTSCIAGHLHLWSMAYRTRPDGSKIWGGNAACYLDPDQREAYAGAANEMWARGLLKLYDVKDGDFSKFEWVDIKEVRRVYG